MISFLSEKAPLTLVVGGVDVDIVVAVRVP